MGTFSSYFPSSASPLIADTHMPPQALQSDRNMKLYLLNSKSSIGFHFDDLISSNRFDKLELIIANIKWLWNNEIELMCECRVRSWRTWNCSTFAPTCQSVWSNVNKRRSYSTARNFLSPDHKNNRNDVTRLTRSTSRWCRVASWSDLAHI